MGRNAGYIIARGAAVGIGGILQSYSIYPVVPGTMVLVVMYHGTLNVPYPLSKKSNYVQFTNYHGKYVYGKNILEQFLVGNTKVRVKVYEHVKNLIIQACKKPHFVASDSAGSKNQRVLL